MAAKKGKPAKLLSSSELSRKWGHVSNLAMTVKTEVGGKPWLPSRALGINYLLGGGIPYGKILEIFGYESTGKSLLALDFASCAGALGGVVLWGDAENAVETHWLEENGVDLDSFIIYDQNDIEGFSDWARDMIMYYRSILVNNEPILLVCDSIAAMDCEDNQDMDFKGAKAEMGNRAKTFGKFYRVRNHLFKKYGVCVIMINQVRKKLNASMFESSETTPGGDATKFFASQRLGLNRSTQIKGRRLKSGKFVEDKSNGVKVGQNIIVRTEKNKVAPPRPSLKTQVYFLDTATGYTGYSRYAGLAEILIDEGVVEYRGARYYFKSEMIAHGEDNFMAAIADNSKLRRKLIAASSINTVSKTRELLEALGKNLYPVKSKANKNDNDGDDAEEEDSDN
jgi:recombination protein RecA